MDNEKLQQITSWLRENVFQDVNFMFSDGDAAYPGGVHASDIIASLHNLLYEQVTGKRYDYMFHWANKIGSDTADNIFDGDEIGYNDESPNVQTGGKNNVNHKNREQIHGRKILYA